MIELLAPYAGLIVLATFGWVWLGAMLWLASDAHAFGARMLLCTPVWPLAAAIFLVYQVIRFVIWFLGGLIADAELPWPKRKEAR